MFRVTTKVEDSFASIRIVNNRIVRNNVSRIMFRVTTKNGNFTASIQIVAICTAPDQVSISTFQMYIKDFTVNIQIVNNRTVANTNSRIMFRVTTYNVNFTASIQIVKICTAPDQVSIPTLKRYIKDFTVNIRIAKNFTLTKLVSRVMFRLTTKIFNL